jgi:hypothetical protein
MLQWAGTWHFMQKSQRFNHTLARHFASSLVHTEHLSTYIRILATYAGRPELQLQLELALVCLSVWVPITCHCTVDTFRPPLFSTYAGPVLLSNKTSINRVPTTNPPVCGAPIPRRPWFPVGNTSSSSSATLPDLLSFARYSGSYLRCPLTRLASPRFAKYRPLPLGMPIQCTG